MKCVTPCVEYIIKCPKCSAKAVAVMQSVGIKGTYREPTLKMGVRRILCESCGLSKEVAPPDARRYELWYARAFRGHRLWAVNRVHVSFIISWLSGSIRKEDLRLSQRAMVEAFPKWMVLAKNRSAILQCLQKMYDT